MINGEKWLAGGICSELIVIPLQNYTHNSTYSLPIRPSPNLPNDQSINLYPSLCLFEGTNVNVGRGTALQFQIYGSPFLSKKSTFSFTPNPNKGARNPKHSGITCYGEDLRKTKKINSLNLSWLQKAKKQNSKDFFFNSYFTKLAGTTQLQKQLEDGIAEKVIKTTWKEGLRNFKRIRSKYLIYK